MHKDIRRVYINIYPCYIRDLSILRVWNPQGSWNRSFTNTKGQPYLPCIFHCQTATQFLLATSLFMFCMRKQTEKLRSKTSLVHGTGTLSYVSWIQAHRLYSIPTFLLCQCHVLIRHMSSFHCGLKIDHQLSTEDLFNRTLPYSWTS